MLQAQSVPQEVETGWLYAERVLNGDIVAGELVRLACQRAFDMVDHVPEGTYYDEAAAQHVIDFFGYLRHLKGPLAGQPLRLADWQIFIISQLYGWKAADGRRLFRTCYIEVPRKNGKSTFCAGLGLYHLLADGESSAEVYSAATTRDQARIVFDDASKMVKRSELSKFLRPYRTSIMHEDSGSTFKPLSADADSLEGLSPSFAVVDELHVHKTPEVWDVINVATGARAQPLLFGITTAGTNQTGICYETRDYGIKVLQKHLEDYTFLCCVWTIDEGDDWRDPEIWEKANPNYGVSVYPDDLERLCKQAQESASSEVNFRTKRLNEWRNASQAWLRSGDWEICQKNSKPPLDYWIGKPCYVGLDLAQVSDIAAAVFLFWEGDKIYPYGRYYVPEDTVYEATGQLGVLYRKWVKEGWLQTTEGNVTDLHYIEQDICDVFERFDLREVAFDPHGAQAITASLIDKGLPLVKQPQGIMALSDPSKELEKMVRSASLCPGDDPVMAWSSSNCVIYVDPNDNIKVKKENYNNKIDPIIALIMAIARFQVNGGVTKPSPYEKRGIRTL